jgi:hypothetical protein
MGRELLIPIVVYVVNNYTHRGSGSDKLKADISVADGEGI